MFQLFQVRFYSFQVNKLSNLTFFIRAFLTKYALKEHTNHHKQIKNHACSICGKRFVTASMLKRHAVIHTNGFKCSHCDRTFRSMAFQRSHMRMAHPDTDDASKKINMAAEDPVIETDSVLDGCPDNQNKNEVRISL